MVENGVSKVGRDKYERRRRIDNVMAIVYFYCHHSSFSGRRRFDGLPADGILMEGLNTILIARGLRLIKKLIFAVLPFSSIDIN